MRLSHNDSGSDGLVHMSYDCSVKLRPPTIPLQCIPALKGLTGGLNQKQKKSESSSQLKHVEDLQDHIQVRANRLCKTKKIKLKVYLYYYSSFQALHCFF